MNTQKKEIEDLYFLEVTANYVVVNDSYHGLSVMNFDLNLVGNVELEDDIVINFSVKHEDELLLFSYENECAFYVNLKTENIHRYDLSKYSDMYFSHIYFWKDNMVYLFANGGELSVKIDLSRADMIKLSPSEFSMLEKKNCYKELLGKNILSYNNDTGSSLIIQNTNYCIWNLENQVVTDMNIAVLSQKKDELPSDQIYCKTSFSQDAVVCISEKTMLIYIKNREDLHIYPPYEMYRFFEGKIANYNKETLLFALCNDNSSEGPSLLMKYSGFD